MILSSHLLTSQVAEGSWGSQPLAAPDICQPLTSCGCDWPPSPLMASRWCLPCRVTESHGPRTRDYCCHTAAHTERGRGVAGSPLPSPGGLCPAPGLVGLLRAQPGVYWPGCDAWPCSAGRGLTFCRRCIAGICSAIWRFLELPPRLMSHLQPWEERSLPPPPPPNRGIWAARF